MVTGLVVNARPNLPRADFDRLKAILADSVARLPRPGEGCGCAGWADGLRLGYHVPGIT